MSYPHQPTLPKCLPATLPLPSHLLRPLLGTHTSILSNPLLLGLGLDLVGQAGRRLLLLESYRLPIPIALLQNTGPILIGILEAKFLPKLGMRFTEGMSTGSPLFV